MVFDHWNVAIGDVSIFRLAHDNFLDDPAFLLLYPYFTDSRKLQKYIQGLAIGKEPRSLSGAHLIPSFADQTLHNQGINFCCVKSL